MRRFRGAPLKLGLAFWALSAALFFGVSSPAAAQEATPAAVEVVAETAGTTGVGGTEAAAVPSTGVGSGLTGAGTSHLALGAAVGAIVAAVAALRERYHDR